MDAALARARAEHRPVMIDFFAEWCAACKELDRETYVAPGVVDEAERFVRIKVDGTNAVDPVDALYAAVRSERACRPWPSSRPMERSWMTRG